MNKGKPKHYTQDVRPKPSKKQRTMDEKREHDELYQHRKKQFELAYLRDNGLCVFCYFLRGVRTHAADVHHVYGRGKYKGSWREDFRMMVCTCRRCHPQPIYGGQGTSIKLKYVETMLDRANQTPINSLFKYEDTSSHILHLPDNSS
jgi:hypothetical protein